MTFLIILSFLFSLVACLPGPLANVAGLAANTQSTGRQTLHDRAQFSFKNWTLTEVCMDCTRASAVDLFDCAYTFHWLDPNFNTSSSCNSSWKWDGITMQHGPNNTYNTDYITCEMQFPEAWQLMVNNITDDGLFELGLVHTCKDHIHFDPAELANFFAWPNVTMQLIGRDEYTIVYAADGPVSVLVQGLDSSPI
ncbi:hypothetical protein PG985_010206 [Apiospora marii]|uniref:Uncharacterized protein n=1 Tax=Apiospora marii TaxID=335849 RepID=A0ABR1RL86_9PEZI